MNAKYNKAQLEKGLADGTNQLDDRWVRKRQEDKVCQIEAAKIREAMRNGAVEKWLIRVKPDGTSYASKVDADDYVTGKVSNF
jgi:hypothetical protein